MEAVSSSVFPAFRRCIEGGVDDKFLSEDIFFGEDTVMGKYFQVTYLDLIHNDPPRFLLAYRLLAII